MTLYTIALPNILHLAQELEVFHYPYPLADVPLKKAYIVDREIGVSIKAEEWLDIDDKGGIIISEKLDRDHEVVNLVHICMHLMVL